MADKEQYILEEAELFVTDLFKDSKNLVYHNIGHTREVVDRVNEIAAHYQVSEMDTIALNLAAWFHDCGHVYTTPSGHEEKSVEIARQWLDSKPAFASMANEVADLIMSTRPAVQPDNLRQQIIKDADTYHFGTGQFKKSDKKLKKEMKLRNFLTLHEQWDKNTLRVLEEHRFHTDYCRGTLEEGKDKNIKRVVKKIARKSNKKSTPNMLLGPEGSSGSGAKPSSYITKGIQTMLRLTSENHMRLSDMADTKANILISVNAIIISVILSVLIRKIEVDAYLTIPTFIFLAFSLATIVMAILATRPKITKGNFNRQEVLERRTNLLFFGNFYKTKLDEYKWGMGTMMKDPDYIYGSLVDDIYYLGRVLGSKYKLISIAYMVFMTGIIVSVIAFSLAILFHQPDAATAVVQGTGSPF